MSFLSDSAAACRLLAVAAALHATAAAAGSFHVSPVRIELSTARPIATIQVTNNEDRQTRIQLQQVNWTHDEIREAYSDTRTLIANPPIFTLPPRGSQVIRIGLAGPMDTPRELAYRVFLEEISDPGATGPETGLKLQLRVGLPVFVMPAKPVKPELRWSARRIDGEVQWQLKNEGAGHLQVREQKIYAGNDSKPLATIDNAQYVLPGRFRSWQFKPEAKLPAGPLRITAQTNIGPVHAEIPMANP